mgnify:CR=1 FL=1
MALVIHILDCVVGLSLSIFVFALLFICFLASDTFLLCKVHLVDAHCRVEGVRDAIRVGFFDNNREIESLAGVYFGVGFELELVCRVAEYHEGRVFVFLLVHVANINLRLVILLWVTHGRQIVLVNLIYIEDE